jgi:fimbrial chaperone protein
MTERPLASDRRNPTRLLDRVSITPCLFVILFWVTALPVAAGEYSVSPMRLDFDRETKSGIVTLKNVGSARLGFQLKAMEWKQDGAGKDVYVDTTDIIFFPRILTIEPSEERIIRVGVKVIPAAEERAFRLFIETLPEATSEPVTQGAHLNIIFRFALPIFVEPAVHQPKGQIASATFAKGELTLVLKNLGNEHYRVDDGVVIKGVSAQGEQVFTHTFPDRYVLAGVTKRYVTIIPAATCHEMATLEVNAKTEQFTLAQTLKVDAAMCR